MMSTQQSDILLILVLVRLVGRLNMAGNTGSDPVRTKELAVWALGASMTQPQFE